MELSAPGLAQLLGLDTSTWVAIAAASIALAGVGVNFWNVSRTLKRAEENLELTIAHSEEQARLRSYNEARDRALGQLARAHLAIHDLTVFRLEIPRLTTDYLGVARQVLGDLRAAQIEFAAYASPDDPILPQLAEGAAAYESAVETVWRQVINESSAYGETGKRFQDSYAAFRVIADRLLETTRRVG